MLWAANRRLWYKLRASTQWRARMRYQLDINGESRSIDAPPEMPRLWCCATSLALSARNSGAAAGLRRLHGDIDGSPPPRMPEGGGFFFFFFFFFFLKIKYKKTPPGGSRGAGQDSHHRACLARPRSAQVALQNAWLGDRRDAVAGLARRGRGSRPPRRLLQRTPNADGRSRSPAAMSGTYLPLRSSITGSTRRSKLRQAPAQAKEGSSMWRDGGGRADRRTFLKASLLVGGGPARDIATPRGRGRSG